MANISGIGIFGFHWFGLDLRLCDNTSLGSIKTYRITYCELLFTSPYEPFSLLTSIFNQIYRFAI